MFRTYDPAADRLLAVKSFRLDLIPEDVARLADALRRLIGVGGHVGAGLEGASAYVALPFHAAETLDVALRHLAPAPLEVAVPILRGLGAAVDAAWAAGPHAGHGALHPRDVFVAPETREVAVTGFGIVPALDALGASGARAPIRRPYTAPERAVGAGWDQRADVFSVAAIAHELLTGRRPAGPGEQDGALPPAWSPEARAAVRRVLARGLAESPAQRFATAAEFVDALAASGDAAAGILPFDGPEPIDSPLDALAPVATLPIVPDVPVPAAPPARAAEPVRVRAGAPPRERRPAPSRDAAADLRLDTSFDMPLPPPLPPPIPWVVVVAVAVATAIVSGAAFYHLGLTRGRNEAAQIGPPPAAPATAPSTPAATDTEVAVTPPPANSAPVAPSPAAGPGRLTIRSTPSGAAVTIDGRPAGRTPLTVTGLAIGTYGVVVSRPGFRNDSRRVPLTRRASSATINATLKVERAPARGAAAGSLVIETRPRGAQVAIDGKAVGLSPLSLPGLAPGTYSVRLTLTGYAPLTTSVTVKAGETARLAVTLEQR